MTQNEKLLNALESGVEVSAALAQSRYGIKNLRARVNDLRESGVCVYTNRKNGRTTYRIGKPTRSMIAVAFQAFGAEAFGS